MSTPLFDSVLITHSTATAAGSNTVVRATTTVPAGKRGRITHCYLQVNTNGAAANTVGAYLRVVRGGTTLQVLRLMDRSGIAVTYSKESILDVALEEGDVVDLVTDNFSVVIVSMAGGAALEIYG